MNNGWIKLHRQILDNPITTKPDWAWLWIVILLLANHQDTQIIWNREKRIMKRGSFITSRQKLSLHSGIHESSVERALKYFKNEHQIEQQANKKFRLITIVKYNDYQTDEQVIEHQMNNKRTSNEQQLNIDKNDKNVKNDKKEKKNTYGELQNVFLTEEEYKKLETKLGGADLTDAINRLDLYIASKGKKYKSHYATILNWQTMNAVNKKIEPKIQKDYDLTKIKL